MKKPADLRMVGSVESARGSQLATLGNEFVSLAGNSGERYSLAVAGEPPLEVWFGGARRDDSLRARRRPNP
jgi:hypothetical protein